MALLHQAELRPSKLELLSTWVFGQQWFSGDADGELTTVASFRFDDPEGEVGVETILVQAGSGPTLQVPLTYRSSPLDGAGDALIGTMEHSVLGKRWVYDGVGDPVYLQTAASAAINGGQQAALFVDIDGQRIERTPSALVSGTGTGSTEVALPMVDEIVVSKVGGITVVVAGNIHLQLLRVVGADGSDILHGANMASRSSGVLEGTWKDSKEHHELLVASLI